MTEETQTTQTPRIPRRTLAAGVAWSAPAIAVASAAPSASASVVTTTTTLPPCITNIGTTGGTYPVTYDLSGCTTDGTHWDFRFRITAAPQDGTDCNCPFYRITLFDNPKRSRLWITGSGQFETIGGDPATNTNSYNRLFVQKVILAGQTGEFPATNDQVRRVAAPPGTTAGNPDTGFTSFTTSGTTAVVGNIEPLGQSNDTVHVLMNASGSVPCGASGPMAYYRVECGPSQNGPWEVKADQVPLNPCVPMIQSTICRYDSSGNDRFTLGVSVLNSCGLAPGTFRVTSVYRNSDTNFPNTGGSTVWSGNQALGAGTTNINTTSAGAGTQLWISFTTDGLNTSVIRVPTTTTNC